MNEYKILVIPYYGNDLTVEQKAKIVKIIGGATDVDQEITVTTIAVNGEVQIPTVKFIPPVKNMLFLKMEFEHLKKDPENIIALSIRMAKRLDDKLFRDVIQELYDHKSCLNYAAISDKTDLPVSLIQNIIRTYGSICKYV